MKRLRGLNASLGMAARGLAKFFWDNQRIAPALAKARRAQGQLQSIEQVKNINKKARF